MARQNQTEDWLDHVGKGFWFAVGFTPAFVILSGLMSFLFMMMFLGGVRLALPSFIPVHDPAPVRYVSPSPTPAPAPVKKPVAIIKETVITDEVAQERECSLLLLKYQQTQDESIKQQMYKVCP